MTDTPWTPRLRAVWARVRAHSFSAATPLDFTRRLARDKGWPRDFAEGAIEEYRRFCFLAFTGAGPVTPSEEVDEVWHLHLTYTRDYWEVWCAAVLGGPLHHDPTAGGPVEQHRFRDQYAATLALYERFFGPPPSLFWPAAHERFRNARRFRAVDASRWFLLPRPRAPWHRFGKGRTP